MNTTVVMTGATSGLGAIAADRISKTSGVRVLYGSRQGASGGDSLPLDLATLGSVRAFADAVVDRLAGEDIDVLVLNAGIILASADERTVDGFEKTFAVNHLGPYFLLRLLMPRLAQGATVVLTSSGTHDPANETGLAPPRHADGELLAYPDRDPGVDPRPAKAGEHAYTASKLCTVLTVRALLDSPAARDLALTAIAYDPGQVFGTRIVQDLPLFRRVMWSILGTAVGGPLRWFNEAMNTQQAAGNALAALSLGEVDPPEGRSYTALRRGKLTWPEPSEVARQVDAARSLWRSSERLTQTPPQITP